MTLEACDYTANVERWTAGEIRRLETADAKLSNRIETLYYLLGELTASVVRLQNTLGSDSSLQPAGELGGESRRPVKEQDVDG